MVCGSKRVEGARPDRKRIDLTCERDIIIGILGVIPDRVARGRGEAGRIT
jgi:hypothetical protein